MLDQGQVFTLCSTLGKRVTLADFVPPFPQGAPSPPNLLQDPALARSWRRLCRWDIVGRDMGSGWPIPQGQGPQSLRSTDTGSSKGTDILSPAKIPWQRAGDVPPRAQGHLTRGTQTGVASGGAACNPRFGGMVVAPH